jgi:hypothetical protein
MPINYDKTNVTANKYDKFYHQNYIYRTLKQSNAKSQNYVRRRNDQTSIRVDTLTRTTEGIWK